MYFTENEWQMYRPGLVEGKADWSVPLLFACNTFILLMTRILCVAGPGVPLDD